MSFGVKRIVLLSLIVAVFSSVFIITIQLKARTELSLAHLVSTTPSSALSNFDPAYYGLPEVIAGYKILLVETPENIACMVPGTIRLVLQTSQPDLDSFLKHTPSGNVENELKKLNIKPEHWDIEYAGPGVSKQDALSALKDWNPKSFPNCFKTGPIS